MSSADSSETVLILVPEIRDYERVNLEIVGRLQAGFRRILLQGVEGQRLLVSGIAGDWEATVIVEGRAGPDLGAGLNAPKLKVVCQGDVADGVGHSLRAGFIQVVGDAGTCAGYGQRGGVILLEGNVGPRAGLNQKGGLLVLLGTTALLAGERRTGGTLAAFGDRLGRLANYAATGGRSLALDREELRDDGLDSDVFATLTDKIEAGRPSSFPTSLDVMTA